MAVSSVTCAKRSCDIKQFTVVNLADGLTYYFSQTKMELGAKDLDSGHQIVVQEWVWPDEHEALMMSTLVLTFLLF